MKLLSICFINYNDHEKLKFSIPALMSLLAQLDKQKRECLEVIVSDNQSESRREIEDLLSKFPEIRLVSTSENSGVDVNIRNCFVNANSRYVWIFAADDYIQTAEHLNAILNFLIEKKPTLLSFKINLDITSWECTNLVPFELVRTKDYLKQIINSGKISTAIYQKNCELEDVLNEADGFIGLGYYHLSYGACLKTGDNLNRYFWDMYVVYTLHAKVNHKHEYHPRYSHNAYLSVANKYFLSGSFKLRWIVRNHLLFQLRFVLVMSRGKITQWDENQALSYIEEIGTKCRVERSLFLKFVVLFVRFKLIFAKNEAVKERFIRGLCNG